MSITMGTNKTATKLNIARAEYTISENNLNVHIFAEKQYGRG